MLNRPPQPSTVCSFRLCQLSRESLYSSLVWIAVGSFSCCGLIHYNINNHSQLPRSAAPYIAAPVSSPSSCNAVYTPPPLPRAKQLPSLFGIFLTLPNTTRSLLSFNAVKMWLRVCEIRLLTQYLHTLSFWTLQNAFHSNMMRWWRPSWAAHDGLGLGPGLYPYSALIEYVRTLAHTILP